MARAGVLSREAERIFTGLSRIGGRPCLDLVNTVSWRRTDEPRDRLPSYDHLVHWGLWADLLSEAEAAAALEAAQRNTARARRLLGNTEVHCWGQFLKDFMPTRW